MRKGGPKFAEWLGLAMLSYAHTGQQTWKEVSNCTSLAIAVGIDILLLKNN